MKVVALSPSEALYGFAGWLTSRKPAVTMSSHHQAAIVAQLVDVFCQKNGLEPPRDTWEKALVHPGKCARGPRIGAPCETHGRTWPCIDVEQAQAPDYAVYFSIVQAAEPALDYINATLKHNPPMDRSNFQLLAATAAALHRALYPNKEPPTFTYRPVVVVFNEREPSVAAGPGSPPEDFSALDESYKSVIKPGKGEP